MTEERDQLAETSENGTAVEQAEAIAAQAFVTETGSVTPAAAGPSGGQGGGQGGAPSYYASREMLDREMAEIKDEVLRMGSLVATQIGIALDALVSHDAEKATTAIVGDGRINEAQRHIAQLITTTIGAHGTIGWKQLELQVGIGFCRQQQFDHLHAGGLVQ